MTRKRLYLDTMEQVLGNTGKVLVQRGEGGQNLIYLPLERMLREGAGSEESSDSSR
ncbi:MAG: protease modulator HflK, partial [Gammaproteobacteria bacterium]|nr:protease modulator HflK [Gammaproteobacteria bacterium]